MVVVLGVQQSDKGRLYHARVRPRLAQAADQVRSDANKVRFLPDPLCDIIRSCKSPSGVSQL